MSNEPITALLQLLWPWLLAAIIPGILSAKLARKKGYSGKYFWLGFFLSIFGLVYVAGLPDSRE